MAKRALAMIALLAIAAPAIARDQDVPPNRNGQIEFITPTGNIGCIYTPRGGTDTYMPSGDGPELSCSRVEPSYVTLTMGPSGYVNRINNPGEQGCCGDATRLAYGNSWRQGPFSCTSTTAGLSCSGPGGHGFFVSRGKITTR